MKIFVRRTRALRYSMAPRIRPSSVYGWKRPQTNFPDIQACDMSSRMFSEVRGLPLPPHVIDNLNNANHNNDNLNNDNHNNDNLNNDNGHKQINNGDDAHLAMLRLAVSEAEALTTITIANPTAANIRRSRASCKSVDREATEYDLQRVRRRERRRE